MVKTYKKNKKNKNKKTKKLHKIFDNKKHKILLTKYYGFDNKKGSKKSKTVPKHKIKSIKKRFLNKPLNFLPLEDLFLNKNMNNLEINVNPYVKQELQRENDKHKNKLNYIRNDVNKKYKEIINQNKGKVNKIYDEILSREYDINQLLFNNSVFDYNIYEIFYKNLNYPKLVFKNNCGNEFTFFDFNKIAKKFEYFKIGNIFINDEYFIFSADLYGNNLYHIFFKKLFENSIKDIELKTKRPFRIRTHDYFNIVSSNSNGNFIYDNNNLYFISTAKDYVYNELFYYNLETNYIKKLFKNKDEYSFFNIFKTNGKIFVNICRYDGNSLHFIDGNKINTIIPFRKNYNYEIDFLNNTYFILENFKSNNAIYKTFNFKTKTLLHKSNNKADVFENLYVFNSKFILCTCKRYNETYLVIINLCNNKTKYLLILSENALSKYSNNKISTQRNFYNITYKTTPNSFSANDLYIFVTSFLVPRKTLYVHLEREVMHLLDDTTKSSSMLLHSYYNNNYKLLINNKFNESDYEDKLIYIPNTPKVAVYLMYKKGLKLNNKNKCLLLGYGAYGTDFTNIFKSTNGGAFYYTSLMDRGFVIAISYIRGGLFGGYNFHKDGRMKNRKNVYNDFIKISKFLINNNITEPNRFAIYGRSAGGLLIGNVINMEPELYKLAILGVPFVMPYNVMVDKNNPLAYESHYEFGNPLDSKQRETIKKQSPYLQVKKDKSYPNVFMYANIYDSLTPYSEGYNYYHKLKECDVFKNNKRDLVYFLNDKYGHKQSSKKLEKIYDFACFFTVITKYIQ